MNNINRILRWVFFTLALIAAANGNMDRMLAVICCVLAILCLYLRDVLEQMRKNV